MQSILTTSCGYDRCRFSFSQLNNFIGSFRDVFVGDVVTFGFFSCEITRPQVNADPIFVFGDGVKLITLNCSVANTGTGGGGATNMFFRPWLGQGPTWRSRGCIFSHQNLGGTLAFATGDTAATYDFADNVYVNIGVGHYSDTANSTAALWLANVDTGAIQGTTSPFQDVTVDLRLNAAGTLFSTKKMSISPHAVNGINRTGFSGNYGAWQYPMDSAMRMRSGSSRRGLGPR